MSGRFRLTLAQINSTLGDLTGNRARAREGHAAGKAAGADFVALPEMFLVGQYPRDLTAKAAFCADAWRELQMLAVELGDGPALGIGLPILESDGRCFNAYAILRDGKLQGYARKHHLPNHGAFDETRIFASGPVSGPFGMGPVRVGVPIGEDARHPDVTETLAECGAEILFVPDSSPYHHGIHDLRIGEMVTRVVETGLPFVYLNAVGGQDEQIFDGGSFVLNPHGRLAVQLPSFDEVIAHVDFEETAEGWCAVPGERAIHPPLIEQDYRGMIVALHDHVTKSGVSKVVLGLSGGVDSALVAAIAADALGPENLRCVTLPSEDTSAQSLEDATGLAKALGCPLHEVPIAPARAAITETLQPLLNGRARDATEATTLSRLRGLLLMTLSEAFGEMLLIAGNKIDLAVGYIADYGGYNPIKDLYKSRVIEICRWRNANHRPWMKGNEGEVIPVRVIDEALAAEQRADGKAGDALPPLGILDRILEHLIEDDMGVGEIVDLGFEREEVKRVEHRLYSREAERLRAAPGPKLTRKAFWPDRRYPVVHRWRDPT
ncbi:NAD+ synthase [Amaricoccus macauensis]|uniref:NAD+ synthase n=1 Tax=Amaricoccus macauensis TaxID=57001 RepID=UPI003C7BE24F